HVGGAARHAGAEVPPGRAEHEHGAAGHVLAAVVAHALDDQRRAGVAHREPLPHDTAQVDLARGGAVGDDVAGDDVLTGREHRGPLRAHDDPPAREALADVDRKSTRLNSSHVKISYAVFCLKKKKKNKNHNSHDYTLATSA